MYFDFLLKTSMRQLQLSVALKVFSFVICYFLVLLYLVLMFSNHNPLQIRRCNGREDKAFSLIKIFILSGIAWNTSYLVY